MSDNKRYVSQLTLLCAVTYFVSYITRINYGAVLLEMVNAEGISKTAASMALTGSAVTYGIGQVASGFMGDRVKPQWLIFVGLLVSAVMNVMVPLFPLPYAMLGFWCVNGFAQALMWPPMVKIMSGMLTPEQYKKTCVKVSWGSSCGTIAVYLLSPVGIELAGWKSVFYVCAIASVVFSVVWIKGYGTVSAHFDNRIADVTVKSHSTGNMGFDKGMFLTLGLIMLAIVAQGYLRDGVTTWMPTYISETYNLGSAISILTGVALPVFSILTFQATSYINRKLIKNEVACAAAVFALGCAAAFVLFVSGNLSPAVSVLLSTVVTGCMHGVNLMLICMLPPYFVRYGRVAFMSGLLNSCTYVGSAVSSYGMAAIAERWDWNAVILSWGIVALAGTLLCVVCVKRWEKVK